MSNSETCNINSQRLREENATLLVENTILERKNNILTEICEQYTSENKYVSSCHKLHIAKYEDAIDEFKLQIQFLQESNHKLTTNHNALKTKITGYKQKNRSLLQETFEKETLSKKLKQLKLKIKILKQQNSDIKKQLDTLKITEITPRELMITTLKIQLHKLHEVFEKNKMRRASNTTIKLHISDSIATKTKRHSESITLNYSTSNKPRWYVNDSYNVSPSRPHAYVIDTSASTSRYVSDEESDYKQHPDNMYTVYNCKQLLPPKLAQIDDTLHINYSCELASENEIGYTRSRSIGVYAQDSNKETQDLVILDTYTNTLSGEDSAQDTVHVIQPTLHSSHSLSLRNSQTETAEDVQPLIIN